MSVVWRTPETRFALVVSLLVYGFRAMVPLVAVSSLIFPLAS